MVYHISIDWANLNFYSITEFSKTPRQKLKVAIYSDRVSNALS